MSIIGLIFTGSLALLFLSAAVAPLESLGWYAGWFGEKEEEPDFISLALVEPVDDEPEAASHYLVYLSGIGAIAPDSIPEEELPFIEGLGQILPGTKVIADVFPYSVTNMGLTGQRVTARIWRWIEQLRLKNPMAVAALLINLRNMFQVAISADRRYGPIYNLGVARAIRASLLRHGYRIGRNTPVTLLGWSGGGQIALGAAWYLPGLIGAPVRVISVGGVMSDDMGVERIEHLWHLWGQKDPLAPLGEWLYAGRWPYFPTSTWNRALADGRITLIPLGPFTHNGAGNYFDNQTTLPSGETHMQHVLGKVQRVMADAGLVSRPPN
ncbi:MAG: hypothetical protein KJZ93_00360 [Caldilineaceae bacterium]|nr:hypothetical protein [Caldilineaceae bacterium]